MKKVLLLIFVAALFMSHKNRNHTLCNGYLPNGDRYVVWFENGKYYHYTNTTGTQRVMRGETRMNGTSIDAINQCLVYEAQLYDVE